MIKQSLVLVIVAFAVVVGSLGPASALDEGLLTPTNDKVVAQEEQEFNAAMGVWFGHKYQEGEKLLREFSKKHPESRWAAEADLHVGCNLVYQKKYGEAKAIFDKLVAKHSDSNIAVKAKVRLGNIAEQTGDYAEAMRQYSEILGIDPTPAQYRYANFHARLARTRHMAKQALINCGPVALASCLNAMGRSAEAAVAKGLSPGDQGMSLADLQSQAEALGVKAVPVKLPFEQFRKARLPVLAYLNPNHYVAVLKIDGGKASVEDSIRGKYDVDLPDLKSKWTEKALVFDQSSGMMPLTATEAKTTLGGCCGHTYECECSGCDVCGCEMITVGPAAGMSCAGDGSGPWGDGPFGNMPEVPSMTTPGFGRCNGCGLGGLGRSFTGTGYPRWKANTQNLNLNVIDTPIWYNPGKGPGVVFTLSYSNENSDSGLFGLGWRCYYDMKVFFLPPADPADPKTLQIHLADGRIETYEWAMLGGQSQYLPQSITSSYGYVNEAYRDASDGSIVYKLRSGGKYVFRPESDPLATQGRIWKIVNKLGETVQCFYDGSTGVLDYILDANNRRVEIDTQGAGADERITKITLPDTRYAEFGYTDGNLTSITDMAGYTSTLAYDAAIYPANASTTLNTTITTTDPDDGGTLKADSYAFFPKSGTVKLTNGSSQSELIGYTYKYHYSANNYYEFRDVTRGATRIEAAAGSAISLPSTTLAQNVTPDPLVPGNGGSLSVANTEGFPNSGWIRVNGGEFMRYTGKTSTTLTGIGRTSPLDASQGSAVEIAYHVPYLESIVTPSGKVRFTYRPYTLPLGPYVDNGGGVALHEAYECGPDPDTYPTVPTWHFTWCNNPDPNGYMKYYGLAVTRYPTTVNSNPSNECDPHWTGGLTKKYYIGSIMGQEAIYDALWMVEDEIGNPVGQYDYYENTYVQRSMTASTNANGNKTEYQYDSNGNMLSRTYTWRMDTSVNPPVPLKATWVYKYQDEFPYKLLEVGNAETTGIDTNDVLYGTSEYHRLVYRNIYNPAGQITEVWKKDESGYHRPQWNSYDTLGRLEWSRAYRNATDYTQTDYHYNELGETRGFLTSTHIGTSETLYHYDAQGRRDAVTDPNVRTTTYQYDDLDRVTKITYPDTNFKEFHYTCCHMDWQKDENGRQTDYVYDSKNRLYQIQAPAAGTTTYVYDSAILDRVNTVVDALNHPTNYEYYPTGKVKKIIYGDGTWEAYEYDGAGNVTRKSDSAGKVTDYGYDANNRLTDIWPL